ncbi:subtilisin-like protein [Tilletiaria anomala UBC 951]|uniref:tripeptidyl-peptidase II n=1 Tax=Tilletiaria anomala (strain ATCC 24038 / CBS 436.72 / UBC 951) TaxID=1037660 RepID=A0A066VR54_TILAU|nr:subtilisin-like protein [Tilletiaria anomala UBC 951]KDN43926.1 subtilisin-like protein [Tilletiaria anomala UBC 951]
MISKALICLALASSTLGAVINAPAHIPDAFKAAGTAPDSQPVTITLHLKEADMPGLTTRMQQIASSGGAWLTPDQLAQYVTPTPTTTSAVKSFLTSAKVPESAVSFNSYGDIATVTTTAGTLKTLFPSTDFTLYNYLSNTIVRTTSLTIPDSIFGAISHVGGLLEFPQIMHFAPASLERVKADLLDKRADITDCDSSHVTPSCLRHYYGTYNYKPDSSKLGNPDITVMGYIGQYVSQADLAAFLAKYRPDAANYNIPIVLAAGGINDPTNPGVEAMLDVETVVAATYPLKSNFISFGTPNDADDIFAQTFDYLRVSDHRPSVVTISYGADEKGFSQPQAEAMCNSAQKLSALGTTIVISSGDRGIDGSGITNNDVCLATALSPFIPTYPGGCPYVSSIGATQGFPEVMVSATIPDVDGFFSGAGRSNMFPIPSFQSKQVATSDSLLKPLQTPPGSYNKTGRSFPDYVAAGLNYAVIVKGQEELVGGTSASAPTTASVFALLNNALLSAGKSTLGWSQPRLYPLASSAFNDIQSGGSYGCALSSSVTPIGFPAHLGFDGASGIGSPRFESIRSALGA